MQKIEHTFHLWRWNHGPATAEAGIDSLTLRYNSSVNNKIKHRGFIRIFYSFMKSRRGKINASCFVEFYSPVRGKQENTGTYE